ncbi:MAG: LysM peptidoglycan-binding domain-containing protein [Atopobiaceae bacterium]
MYGSQYDNLFDGTAVLKPQHPRTTLRLVDAQAMRSAATSDPDRPHVRSVSMSQAQGRAASVPIRPSQVSQSTGQHLSVMRSAVVAVVATLCVSAVLLGCIQARSLLVNRTLDSTREEYVDVQPGDSLWTLAQEHPVSGADTSEVMSWIQRTNGLTDTTLRPGQEIIVPVVG